MAMRWGSKSSRSPTTCSKWKRAPSLRHCSECSSKACWKLRLGSRPRADQRGFIGSLLLAFVISKEKLSVSRGCLQAFPVCLQQPKHRRCGLSRFSLFFSRNRRYDDISVSIQEHIDERIDEL